MDGQKVIIFMMCFNIMLYLLGFSLVDGDLLSRVYDTSSIDITSDVGNFELKEDVQNSFPKNADSSGATALSSFIDGLSLIWSLVLLIFNLLTSPIAIFSFLHPIIAIMLGIPMSFMYLLAIIKFVRGADF
jgi:hypothetical protein